MTATKSADACPLLFTVMKRGHVFDSNGSHPEVLLQEFLPVEVLL